MKGQKKQKAFSPDQAIKQANAYIDRMEATEKETKITLKKEAFPLKVGVDLGTSNIVVTELDQNNNPIAYTMQSARVVKDGIVVNFLETTAILKKRKLGLEKRLGVTLNEVAAAIPPGVGTGNAKVMTNVVTAAGFTVTKIVDEPEAAAIMLGIENEAVVDIGGGTTGISILKNNTISYSVDEPTGGTHMALVVAGGMGIEFEEAESYKLTPNNAQSVLPMITPVIEKMATITKNNPREKIDALYLAGGASGLSGIDAIFESYTGIKSFKPANTLLVTPIGIAMSLSQAV